MLLWTPLGLWVALPQVAKTISLHPPTFVSPILLSNVANIFNSAHMGTVHVATVLLAAVGLIWSQLLEAGRRASLDPQTKWTRSWLADLLGLSRGAMRRA